MSKNNFSLFALLLAFLTAIGCQDNKNKECTGGWKKYENNPVLGGGNLGTIFDVSVLKGNDGVYRMYCSWRPERSIAISESRDGLEWSDPVICLSYVDTSRWEKDLNRPVVIEKDGIYHMWYTGQTEENSRIGYAVSRDGKNWTRKSIEPVLSPDVPWEKVAVMCPHVIWDEKEKLFKMWYSAGEQYEPDAIGYATSIDGMKWEKYSNNPVFTNDVSNEWEQAKVTACQVIKRSEDFLMFYIGFRDIDYAQIGMARSADGISGWERFKENPIIKPGSGWDSSAVYKPYVITDRNRWLLYYNGRNENLEQIGIAIHDGINLGF